MHSLVRICVFFSFTLGGCLADLPVKVENSESVKVDDLVAKLVSRRPAPYPTGYFTEREVPYITPEVDAAWQKLKDMGPQIFPLLVTHLRDDRYSFSYMVNGWMNCTVGGAVSDVLSEGTRCPYQYLARETPSGHSRCPSFKDYLQERKPKEWAEWAKDKTRPEIQVDFLQWCLAQEKKQGFVNDAQRNEIIETYEKAFKEAIVRRGKPHQ